MALARAINRDLSTVQEEILSLEHGMRDKEFGDTACELTYLGLPLKGIPKDPNQRYA